MQLNAQYDSIGKQFVQHFYQTFSSNRESLATLFTDDSMLTHGEEQYRGQVQIMEKLRKLPAVVKHNIESCHCHPTPNNGILVMVCGDLAIEDNPPLKFTEIFNLIPTGTGYTVFNNIFRFMLFDKAY